MPPGRSRGNAARQSPPPFPWDGRSSRNIQRIEANYAWLQRDVVREALGGVRPSIGGVRTWHQRSLEGVRLAEPWVAGHFRGEGPPHSRLRDYPNKVGDVEGAPARTVVRLVTEAFENLDRILDELDGRRREGEAPSTLYSDVLDCCAWVHGQWVRIHPFADHNGSTARLLAVSVALRFGIPLVLPGKPRSAIPAVGIGLDYGVAAANQMLGDDQLMKVFMHQVVIQQGPPALPETS